MQTRAILHLRSIARAIMGYCRLEPDAAAFFNFGLKDVDCGINIGLLNRLQHTHIGTLA